VPMQTSPVIQGPHDGGEVNGHGGRSGGAAEDIDRSFSPTLLTDPLQPIVAARAFNGLLQELATIVKSIRLAGCSEAPLTILPSGVRACTRS
jgi:hypothetical protein